MSVTIDARRTGLTVDTSIPPLTSNATLGPGGGKFFLGGVLAVEHGGTGAAVLPDGQLLIGDGINPVCSSSALQFSIAQRELVLTGGLEQSSGKFSLQGSGPSVLRTRRGDLCVSANDTLRLNAEADCGDVEIGWAGVANTTTGIMTIKLLGDLRQGGGSFVLHGRRDSAVRSTAALRLSAGGVATLESLADKVQIEAAAGCAITTRAAVDIAAADGCSISAGGVGMVGLDRGGLTLGAPDRPSRFRGAVHDPVVEVRGDTLLDASHHTVVVRAVGGGCAHRPSRRRVMSRSDIRLEGVGRRRCGHCAPGGGGTDDR